MDFQSILNGDNFGIHASKPTFNAPVIFQQANDEASKDSCHKSLAFPNMDDRSYAQHATKGSGRWLTDQLQYQDWLKNGGMLWIRGRAGTGKSTLMEYILTTQQQEAATEQQESQNSTSNPVRPTLLVLHHFFRASLGELRRSVCGMFRTLLHQLLSGKADMLARFADETGYRKRVREMGEHGKNWNWSETTMRKKFRHYALELNKNGTRIRVLLDGVDESGELNAPSILKVFQELSNSTSGSISTCFAARPHPWIGVLYTAITVDDHNMEDINTFLEDELRTANNFSDEHRDSIKEKLRKSAQGVFQWLVWIVRAKINKDIGDEPLSRILQRIRGYPKELGDVYASILNEIDEDDLKFAKRIMELLSLAKEPLSLWDLRYAVCLESDYGYDTAEDAKDSYYWCETCDHLTGKLRKITQGLVKIQNTPYTRYAELTVIPTTIFRDCCTIVTFDHESVYEYMKDAGLTLLEVRGKGSPVPLSDGGRHLSMASRCLHHLSMDEVVRFGYSRRVRYTDNWEPTPENVKSFVIDHKKMSPLTTSNLGPVPFTRYAASSWSKHVRAAEEQGTSSHELLARFRSHIDISWDAVKMMEEIAKYDECVFHDTGLNLVHTVCRSGLHRSLHALLEPASTHDAENVRRLKAQCIGEVDSETSHGHTPLTYAAGADSRTTVRTLLDHGVRANHHGGLAKTTALHLAAGNGSMGMIRDLLRCGFVDVDAADRWGSTPLMHAVIADQLRSVRLLAEESVVGAHSSDLLSRNDEVCTPLIWAWLHGSTSTLNVLVQSARLDGDAEVQNGLSLLHCICATFRELSSDVEKFRSLIESGKFSLNLQDSDGMTPLHYAAETGAIDIVKLLVETGKVDLLMRDILGAPPMVRAFAKGHHDIAILLATASNTDGLDFTRMLWETHQKAEEYERNAQKYGPK